MRATSLTLLLCSAMALQGCVAAAIPVVAGGAFLRTQTDGKEPGDDARAKAQQQTALAAKDRLNAIADAEVDTSGRAVGTLAVVAEQSAYADLIRYSRETGAIGQSGRAIPSAILQDPTALDGERGECSASVPTVLIDLDPGETAINPPANAQADPAFALGLETLRAQGIEIAWISRSSAADAGPIRMALKESGLDPEGKDQLILMRYPGDRKQTRRADLASASCIIAIAGDTREDFDELFAYLVNPEAALGLELLIGDGWFLVPPAFEPPPPQTAFSSERKQTP